ncbi:hypothetical protein [Thermoflexus sp.]|jgi:hypothetical protein|uniref:hypothetical protein n=1 Tax=Thermoflexus sp. TaxID=1969742 RepID=UPI003C093527
MGARRASREEAETSAGARLFRTESGDCWLHDPGIGWLAWIAPEDEAQKALQGRNAEMAPIGVLLQPANSHAAYVCPSGISGGPFSCC